MWKFPHMRKIAIRKITDMDSFDDRQLVALGRMYGIKRWLLDGLNRLAQRLKPMQLADSELIGVSLALKLAEVREGYRNFPNLRGSHDFRPAIRVVFESELAAIDGDETLGGRAIASASIAGMSRLTPGREKPRDSRKRPHIDEDEDETDEDETLGGRAIASALQERVG
jgi:hypothetical protein